MNSGSAPALAPESRILIRSVNWLGDAVMSTPALLRLREAYPKASISLLTPAKLADLWRHHPAVNEVLPIGANDGLWTSARRIRHREFDFGWILPNSTRAALELWLGGVPRRFGYAGHGRSWLLTHVAAPWPTAVRMRKRTVREIRRLQVEKQVARTREIGTSAHHIHHYLNMAAQLGANPAPLAPRLSVLDSEVEAFRERFRLNTRTDRRLFGLNPGAEYGQAKRWPAERFIAAACEVQRHTGCRWLIFGAAADLRLATEIAAGIERKAVNMPPGTPCPTVNLAGATSLRELCAGLRACEILLTNDTGPMHVAAAVGTRVIVPFGSTSAALTGPGLPGDPQHTLLQADVPCAPCFLRECPTDFRCMRQIEVSTVVQAILDNV